MWLPCTCGFGILLMILTFPSHYIFTPSNPLSILKHFQLTTNAFCSNLFKPIGNQDHVFSCSRVPCVCVLSCFSHVQLFANLWTIAHQAALPMAFSRQEYWSESPCPPPEGLPDPGIEPESPASLALQADSLPLSHLGNTLRILSLFSLAV